MGSSPPTPTALSAFGTLGRFEYSALPLRKRSGVPSILIIPESLRARHWAGYNRVMATGESHYGQGDLLSVPGLTKDSRCISVEFTIVLLHDNGQRPVGTAAILRDVTKRFEEARELRRQLTESRDRGVKDLFSETANNQRSRPRGRTRSLKV